MKISLRYKILATIILVFILTVSLLFGLTVAPSRTNNNDVYWVFKSWAIVYILVLIAGFWVKSRRFSRLAPAGLLITIAQIIPEFSRLGFKGDNPSVPTVVIVLSSIALGIVLFFSIYLYARPIRIENTKNF